jgi:predicted site-specific integrase-resolvase
MDNNKLLKDEIYKNLMTVSDFAKEWYDSKGRKGVSSQTIRNYLKEGKLRGITVGKELILLNRNQLNSKPAQK